MARKQTASSIIDQIDAAERRRAAAAADRAAVEQWIDGLDFATNATNGAKKRALQAYWLTNGNRTAAADAAGVNRSTIWRWAEDDEIFAAGIAGLDARRLDALRQKLRDKATDDDTTALIFALKKEIPAEYGDSVKVDHGGTVKLDVGIESIAGMTDDEIRAEIARRLHTDGVAPV